MAESGKQNEPISGRRQGDASKCEMNRFGRVTPSAGRDVIDRRASFPSLLARAVGAVCGVVFPGVAKGGKSPWGYL